MRRNKSNKKNILTRALLSTATAGRVAVAGRAAVAGCVVDVRDDSPAAPSAGVHADGPAAPSTEVCVDSPAAPSIDIRAARATADPAAADPTAADPAAADRPAIATIRTRLFLLFLHKRRCDVINVRRELVSVDGGDDDDAKFLVTTPTLHHAPK